MMKDLKETILEGRAPFNRQLEFEKKCQLEVNALYEKTYPGCEIETVNFKDSSKNQELQKQDIDRIIHTSGGGPVTISEKFRSRNNYGFKDIIIEIYGDSSDKSKGSWAINSQADKLYYYRNDQVFITDAELIKSLAVDIREKIKDLNFEEFQKNKNYKLTIAVRGKNLNGWLMLSKPQDPTTLEAQKWTTVNYIVPFGDLESLGIKYELKPFKTNF